VFKDNTACIKYGCNVIGGQEQAKHMDILKHFAHDSEVTQNGEILLVLVATAPMLV
jgi:hypothetical protein